LIVALACLVFGYIFLGLFVTPGRAVNAPELLLDRIIPLFPAWSVIYISHLLLVPLPFVAIRSPELVRRTVLAYLLVWAISLFCFLLYPTVAPRPEKVPSGHFFAWLLGIIYIADPPYNCFPSLHVAHTLVSAFAFRHVHLGVCAILGVWGLLIGQSVLHTKQHYVLDVFVGVLLAILAYYVCLRGPPREAVPDSDRFIAPYLALLFVGAYGITLTGFWLAYRIVTHP
jgi:membrane-associated phospholipid phosphatase